MRAPKRIVSLLLPLVIVGAALAAEKSEFSEPTPKEKAAVKAYLDSNLEDRNYTVVEWAKIPGQNGGAQVFAKVRAQSLLGRWRFEIFNVAMKNGKVLSMADNWPAFPGSPEWNAAQSIGGNLGPAEAGSEAPRPADRRPARAGMPISEFKTYAVVIGPNRIALYRKIDGQWKFQGYAERLADKAALEEISRVRDQEERGPTQTPDTPVPPAAQPLLRPGRSE